MKFSAHFRGPFNKNRRRFVEILPYQGRDTRLEYPGLLSGDLGKSVSEQVTMIQPDTGHYAEFRNNEVGTVKPASETDFNDRPLNSAVSEPIESQCSGNLEERKLQTVELLRPPGQEIIYIFLRNQIHLRFPVPCYPHPFPEIQDVR